MNSYQRTTRLGVSTTAAGAIRVSTMEEVNGIQERHTIQIIETQDAMIRAELIKMGWTPPHPEAEKAYLAARKAARETGAMQ